MSKEEVVVAKDLMKDLEKADKKFSLEQKILQRSQKVEAIKEKLRKETQILVSLQNQKIIKDASEPGALKRLILSYPPCDCKLGEGVFAILITILTLPSKHVGWKKLRYMFPFKERGYKGQSGDCLLEGHIEFSSEEKEILKRYGIKWSYSSYGSIRGH